MLKGHQTSTDIIRLFDDSKPNVIIGPSGMANAACEVFDLVKWENVIGSLAGDNTLIILMRSEEAAKQIVTELRKYIR